MAADAGLEPTLRASKARVLPLHQSAMWGGFSVAARDCSARMSESLVEFFGAPHRKKVTAKAYAGFVLMNDLSRPTYTRHIITDSIHFVKILLKTRRFQNSALSAERAAHGNSL